MFIYTQAVHRSAVSVSAFLLIAALGQQGSAAVVGKSAPPPSLTEERIATLPADQQPAWRAYLARSVAQMKADKAALASERAKLTGPVPPPPADHAHDNSMPLKNIDSWYGGEEARHIADVIVSFQTPAGGWGKNMNRSGALRQPGQDYIGDNNSAFLSPQDFDTPREANWHYVGTLDNNATSTEIRFLARVCAALPGHEGDVYRQSYIRGIRYLLAAQFPNGGWPQVWPLEGGYHDAITYNDDAVSQAAEVLTELAENKKNSFAFVPADLRAAAKVAAASALDIILKTQIVANGVPTIWGQQHDSLTLTPVAARNFEPALPSSEESADLLIYLMSLPTPSPELQRSVHAAARWLTRAAIMNYVWTKQGAAGRHLENSAGAGPLWSRYYTTDLQPRFGDRDKTIHDNVNELSAERRNGYSWFNQAPAKALKIYARWSKEHPAP